MNPIRPLRLLTAAFILLTLGSSGGVSKLFGAPTPTAETLKWEKLVANKLKIPPPPEGSVLCIGSSHMALWKTIQTDLAPLHVYNYGIGGSKMSHAAELFVPNFVIPFKPRAVILYEGSNDLNANQTPEEILKHFRSVYRQIHEALPQTRLYVLGIVPSPGKRFDRWDAIKETNALIQQESKENPWIKFLDTTTPLITQKGMPRPECFLENDIHMNETGYEVWKSVVAPVVVPAEAPFEIPDQR